MKLPQNSKPVPARSYGNLLRHNVKANVQNNNGVYAMFIDYLIVNLKGQPVFDLNYIDLTDLERGCKNFKKHFEIVINSETIGTLKFESFGALDKDLCQFQLSNHIFYTKPANEIEEILNDLFNRLDLKFTSFNRVDLAMDMSNQKAYVKGFVNDLDNNLLRVGGRQKKVTIHKYSEAGYLQCEGVTFGKRSSSCYIRLYDKTREISNNLKTHIIDAWGRLKLNRQDVWRFEAELKNKFFRERQFTFSDLFNRNKLMALFNEVIEKHFVIKLDTGRKRVADEKNFAFFNMAFVSKYFKTIIQPIRKLKRNITETFICQQRMVKGLMRSYFSTGQNEAFLTPLKQIINDFMLWSWYEQKKETYIKEFYKKGIFKSLDLNKLQYDLDINLGI